MQNSKMRQQSEKAITFEIGGICFSVKARHPIIQQRLMEHYRYYICNKKPNIFIEAKHRSCVKKPNLKKVLVYGPTWRLGLEGNYYAIYFPEEKDTSFARINPTFNKIVFYTEDPSGQLLLFLLPEILMGVILPQNNAILMHACGILAGERGYFFPAPSGEGKSTIAKLALEQGFNILNDDRIIIRRAGNFFKICGNPWHGEVENTSNSSVGIKRAFFINKSFSNKVRLMSNKEAMLGFLRNSFYLPVNDDIMKKRFSFCCDLARALKCYSMDFKADKTIWRFLDECLKKNT